MIPLSEADIIGLTLCYFSIGFLFGMAHWNEYYKNTYDFFTTVDIEWGWFLGKLFAWPVYVLGFILLIIFVLFMQTIIYIHEQCTTRKESHEQFKDT